MANKKQEDIKEQKIEPRTLLEFNQELQGLINTPNLDYMQEDMWMELIPELMQVCHFTLCNPLARTNPNITVNAFIGLSMRVEGNSSLMVLLESLYKTCLVKDSNAEKIKKIFQDYSKKIIEKHPEEEFSRKMLFNDRFGEKQRANMPKMIVGSVNSDEIRISSWRIKDAIKTAIKIKSKSKEKIDKIYIGQNMFSLYEWYLLEGIDEQN